MTEMDVTSVSSPELEPNADPLIIRDLSLDIDTADGPRPLLAGINLRVGPSEMVGLVGESGSGKSLTSRAALGLFPSSSSIRGSVIVDGHEIVDAPKKRLRQVRRGHAAMIFQDPRSSVNGVRRVGDFLTEGMRAKGVSSSEAVKRAVELLDEVGIRNPEHAMRAYPHEFSGGMLQRIVIAGALSTKPKLILADEATTALDVTTQAEVVALLKRLQTESGSGLLFVTHDLELASAVCDRVYVMYAGRVIETGPTSELFSTPQHPYTVGLLNSNPKLEGDRQSLTPIAGRPRSLAEAPSGCAFRDRCPIATAACAEEVPPLQPHGGTSVACIRPGESKVSK